MAFLLALESPPATDGPLTRSNRRTVSLPRRCRRVSGAGLNRS